VLSDLSFLNLESTKEGTSHYCLQKSHVSIVICGSDNLQWVGYAFTNNLDDEDEDGINSDETDEVEGGQEDAYEREDDDEDDDGDEGGDEGQKKYKTDMFASDDSYRVLNAEVPKYDAREYWLIVVDLRLRLIVSKWEYVVHKVERSVKSQVGCRIVQLLNFNISDIFRLLRNEDIASYCRKVLRTATERVSRSSYTGMCRQPSF
jgi:hypothetical protein